MPERGLYNCALVQYSQVPGLARMPTLKKGIQ